MQQAQQTLEMIQKHKLIAIVRGVRGSEIEQTAQALAAGGIRLIEVTFDQSGATGVEDTAKAIRSLAARFEGKLCVGAGTVMTGEQLQAAYEAGARYIISPHLDVQLIRATKQLGLVSIPGCFTPSEIAAAYAAGADVVKLFPAGVLGTSYIKAIRAPISHIPLAAVGGVEEENLQAFLKAGISCFGVGSNLVKPSLIREGRFEEITGLARRFLARLEA